MQFDIITLFPEMFSALTDSGITRRAFEEKKCSLSLWNPRDFTQDRHRTVDDRPYGGGPGMVMMVQPLEDAINAAKERQRQSAVTETKVIYLSPQGKPLDHRKVMELKDLPGLILLCGRYEAVDQRLIDSFVDEEISMGDFVLSGGEIPAMALMPLSASCQAFCMMNCRQWKTVLFREFSTVRITPDHRNTKALRSRTF